MSTFSMPEFTIFTGNKTGTQSNFPATGKAYNKFIRANRMDN
jgi:hypothetical protein